MYVIVSLYHQSILILVSNVTPQCHRGFCSFTSGNFNPLTPNIKEQILLSYPNAFLVKALGRSY